MEIRVYAKRHYIDLRSIKSTLLLTNDIYTSIEYAIMSTVFLFERKEYLRYIVTVYDVATCGKCI